MAEENEIILKLKVEEAQAKVSIKKLKEEIKVVGNFTDEYRLKVAKLNVEEQKLANTRQKLSKTTGELIGNDNKGLKGISKASGGATAATLELGRAISDAPYGIRGVANNLSQFASQFSFMSNKVDDATGKVVGFNGALRGLFQAMKANALLLAIQLVIAALDHFAGGFKKAEKSLDGFRVSAAGAASDLTSLLIVMKEDMLSKEDLAVVIDKVNEKYKDLNLSIDKEGKLTKESTTQIDNKIDALGKLAMANAMLSEIQKKRGETAKAAVELQEETSEDLKKLGLKSIADFRDINVQRTDETKQEYIKRKNLLLTTQEGTYKGLVDVDRIARFKRIKREVAAFDETKKRVSTEVLELLKISTDEGFFENFFSSKDNTTGTDIFAGKFVESYYNEIAGLEEIIKDEDFDEISDSAKITGKLILPFKPTFVEPEEGFFEKVNIFIDNYKILMSGLTEFLDGEFERQLTTEQNKTNALNEELNDRLINENLSANQRKNIQNQIAKNDEDLRVKQEAIKKKQFKQQKAFNIAMAVISTYSAAAKVLDDTKGGSFARIAGMVAVIGAGLAQVSAISRQKYQSSSANTPIRTSGGAGGGASERADPSFNIVGRSNDNLLINAIQAQFGKPLKAYVVSRDVTTQQQLDGMIVGQAGT